MKKIIEEDWKPTYFYIRHVTIGQLLPVIKEAFMGFFAILILFGIIGYFNVDDWSAPVYEQSTVNWQKDFLGIDKAVWFLIIFAIISWFIKGKERTFKIPRFDKVEWVMINLIMIIYILVFYYLSWWLGMIAFVAIIVLARSYEDMVYIGRENFKGKNYGL